MPITANGLISRGSIAHFLASVNFQKKSLYRVNNAKNLSLGIGCGETVTNSCDGKILL